MRNFFQITQEVNVNPILEELVRVPNLWNKFPVRKETDGRDFEDVVLRFQKFDTGQDIDDKVRTTTEVVNYPTMDMLQRVKPFLFGLMGMVQGEHLGAAFLGRIAPGKATDQASDRYADAEAKFPDRIPPAYYYERYVLGLSGGGGVMECGGEVVKITAGTALWFNNQLSWSIANSGPDEFQFLMVDVALAKNWYYPK